MRCARVIVVILGHAIFDHQAKGGFDVAAFHYHTPVPSRNFQDNF